MGRLLLLVPLLAGALGAPAAVHAASRADLQSTEIVSKAMDGGPGNGSSVNPAISGDRRFARYVAFESDASNLVPNDANALRDVFLVTRAGPFGNNGEPWSLGGTTLISRATDGGPANGPSGGAALDGSFTGTRGGREVSKPSCVAFVSAASNLVSGDTNGVADAFVSRGPGGAVEKVSTGAGGVTQVAVSGDCTRIAYVEGGSVKVSADRNVVDLGPGQDPSFAVGQTSDLVFGGPAGVELSRDGIAPAHLVVPGGANPSYNDVKCRVVAYEKGEQIAFRKLGGDPGCAIDGGEQVASQRDGAPGNGPSRNPVIGNSGFYITFTSDASDLGVNALGRAGDTNHQPDVYLYTDSRKITLVQSVERKAVPLAGGGTGGTMSYYANYVLFDSPGDSTSGPRQVYLRYLGPI
jgi:hypothetical protein